MASQIRSRQLLALAALIPLLGLPAFAAGAEGLAADPTQVATTPSDATTGPEDGERIAYTAEEISRLHGKLSREIMSPFCAGLTLDNCPTSGAARMRDDILAWLQEGRSEQWILDRLVETWGESVLGAPRFSGAGIVAWIAPGLALFAGAIFLVVYLRNNRGKSEDFVESEPTEPQASDPDRQALIDRIDRELEEHLSA